MNSSKAFKALNIMHKALLMGQVVFSAVCIFIMYAKLFVAPAKEHDKVFQIAVILVAAAGFLGGSYLFKTKLKQIREELALGAKQKFEMYRIACILQWALVEVPVMFAVIAFLMTGNYAFVILSLMLTVYFASLSPVKSRIALQIAVSETELDDL